MGGDLHSADGPSMSARTRGSLEEGSYMAEFAIHPVSSVTARFDRSHGRNLVWHNASLAREQISLPPCVPVETACERFSQEPPPLAFSFLGADHVARQCSDISALLRGSTSRRQARAGAPTAC